MLKVFLVGEQFAAARALAALLRVDRIQLVGVACDNASGSYQITQLARRLDISIFPSKRLNDPEILEALSQLAPDVGLNVNSLVIFRETLLGSFSWGAVNFHPGPLPRYAGLNVHQWAIINGEKEHGVTFHRMERRIDAGDILLEAPVPIEPSDTGLKLYMKCIHAGTQLIEPLMTMILDRTIKARPQDLSERRYYAKGPYRWDIDFRWPAFRIVNLVRALDYRPFRSPMGSPSIVQNGEPLIVPQARPINGRFHGSPGQIVDWTDQDEPVFACGENTALVIPHFIRRCQLLPASQVLSHKGR